jgi:hypothetical protein
MIIHGEELTFIVALCTGNFGKGTQKMFFSVEKLIFLLRCYKLFEEIHLILL